VFSCFRLIVVEFAGSHNALSRSKGLEHGHCRVRTSSPGVAHHASRPGRRAEGPAHHASSPGRHAEGATQHHDLRLFSSTLTTRTLPDALLVRQRRHHPAPLEDYHVYMWSSLWPSPSLQWKSRSRLCRRCVSARRAHTRFRQCTPPCTMLLCPSSHSPIAPSRCVACHLLLTCWRHEQRQVSGTTRATHHMFDRLCKRYMNMASCLLLSDFLLNYCMVPCFKM
jgi:hypothetical protein